jgi:hypothetical protein
MFFLTEQFFAIARNRLAGAANAIARSRTDKALARFASLRSGSDRLFE